MTSFFRFFPVILLFCWFSSFSQNIDSTWVLNNYDKEEVYIPMRDGVKLFTTIYSPRDKSEFHPILILRTPYSVAPYGKNAYSQRLYKSYWSKYLEEGYILVMQDVRGRYMSEGEFEDIRPFVENKKSNKITDESSDAFDSIDWLVKNVQNNSGRVGVFGVSYPGFYATMAALSRHHNLYAVSPQAPVTDWFMGDDFHHNGAFALMDAFSFYSGFGKYRPKPTTKGASGYEFHEKDAYNFHLKQGALANYKKLIGDSVKFWDVLMQHPNYDTFWQARDARRACKELPAAMMVVGGTYDAEDCYGAWNLYKSLVKQSPASQPRLVMGPWFHGGWSRSDGSHLGHVRFGDFTALYYQNNIEVPFFNYHLKLKGKFDTVPKVSVFFSGENKWKRFDVWPPVSITSRQVFLHAGQALSFQPASENESFSKYTSDPSKPVPYADGVHLRRTKEYMSDDQRFAARRPDVLVFETPVLEEDLCLAGPVSADLWVSLSTSDADFVVKLIDVFPDTFAYSDKDCCKGEEEEAEMAGFQMLVRGEIMRGRFRENFEQPQAFVPGQVEKVKFDLPDVAHTFKKGHKLMIQIQSTWFPLFDRNPQQFTDIYTCDNKAFISSEIRLHHSSKYPSCIWLPLLKNN
ncbi:MAG TPA: CocE/NonD family hydrolase [Bacteroidia bacterium]|nr:CocE/NonD family hydrolase [Bacteroidia bacterium]